MEELGLEIRAGLHTGECEIVDGSLRGIAVLIGARVAALAGAGEILLSSTVKDLVAGAGFDSKTAAPTSSRECPAHGRCTP